jgi:hypothetical protein
MKILLKRSTPSSQVSNVSEWGVGVELYRVVLIHLSTVTVVYYIFTTTPPTPTTYNTIIHEGG